MDAEPMLTAMTGQCGEWLRGSGPESDIVISSRIRLARNLAEYPFIRRCNERNRLNIEKLICEKLEDIEELNSVIYLDVNNLADLDRQFLVERQLISRELAESDWSSISRDRQPRTIQLDGERRRSSAHPIDEKRFGSNECLGSDS